MVNFHLDNGKPSVQWGVEFKVRPGTVFDLPSSSVRVSKTEWTQEMMPKGWLRSFDFLNEYYLEYISDRALCNCMSLRRLLRGLYNGEESALFQELLISLREKYSELPWRWLENDFQICTNKMLP